MLNFKIDRDQPILVIHLIGELDEYTSPDLLACVEAEIDRGNLKIVVNCSQLSYISSAGIGVVMRIHSRMKKIDGDVRFASMQGPVASVFKLMQLGRIFQIYDTQEKALASFAG